MTVFNTTKRNWIIDRSNACDIVNKVFTCVKIAQDRFVNMLGTALATARTIWRPGFNLIVGGISVLSGTHERLPILCDIKVYKNFAA